MLQSCTKSKSQALVRRHLGDGVSEKDELVIGPAGVLVLGSNARHN